MTVLGLASAAVFPGQLVAITAHASGLENGTGATNPVTATVPPSLAPVPMEPVPPAAPMSRIDDAHGGVPATNAAAGNRDTDKAVAPSAAASSGAASAGQGIGADGKPADAAAATGEPRATVSAPGAVSPGALAAPVPVSPDAVKKPVAAPQRAALRGRVRTHALKAGMPPEVADAVAEVESGYNVGALGGVGEVGLMQVLPSTARMLGFNGNDTELAEPDTNIRFGVMYLARAWRLANQDLCTTVMKYRAGHGESRFSVRSVDYCRRVRAVLASQGYQITGELPVATFGEPWAGSAAGATSFGASQRRLPGNIIARIRQPRPDTVAAAKPRTAPLPRVRSRMNWSVADARMRAIHSKVTTATTLIAQ